jgi:hypothetical protein
MRLFPHVFACVALLALACGGQPPRDHQAEWRDVLRHKAAAVSPDATPEEKQAYADSVRAFVEKHPDHSRAQQVWLRLQLEFADDLAAVGRYRDAIRFYRGIIARHPENDHARRGLAVAASRIAIGRDDLLTLEKGMSHREVARILGKPLPGWKVENRRNGTTFEAWYYRTRTGSIAGVYFRDGRVFAAEEASNARLGRLGS